MFQLHTIVNRYIVDDLYLEQCQLAMIWQTFIFSLCG